MHGSPNVRFFEVVVLVLGCTPHEVPPPRDAPAPLGSPLASLAPATSTAPVVAIPPTRQKNWPSPLALPCHEQSECGLAECDVVSMMCAFPCRDDDDCVGSAQCNAQVGLCLP